jgi:epoxide hydrolase-like predicted phosphatase
MQASGIKNIIFDLGGVILDLSVDHTLQSFSDLSGRTKNEVEKIFHSTPEFLVYEKGGMTDNEFRDVVRQVYKINAPDSALDKSWNAMLRAMPLDKLSLLDKLKTKYNVFLLSNTNNIHLDYINNVMMPAVSGDRVLDDYFHHAYYSHLMFMRKPDAEIFERVMNDNDLKPSETLFLDDNASNVAGAASVGIQTVHVTSPNLMLEYFNE